MATKRSRLSEVFSVTVPGRWRVHNNDGVVHVPFDLAAMHSDARHRVLHSPRLAPHLDIIMSDGYADSEEHLRWVIRGRVGEIESWAKEIANDRA